MVGGHEGLFPGGYIYIISGVLKKWASWYTKALPGAHKEVTRGHRRLTRGHRGLTRRHEDVARCVTPCAPDKARARPRTGYPGPSQRGYPARTCPSCRPSSIARPRTKPQSAYPARAQTGYPARAVHPATTKCLPCPTTNNLPCAGTKCVPGAPQTGYPGHTECLPCATPRGLPRALARPPPRPLWPRASPSTGTAPSHRGLACL